MPFLRASQLIYSCLQRQFFIDEFFSLQNDQHLFHWRCSLYKSAAEEVGVWGSPLRTSGLLPSTLSTRHITILSGKVTEVIHIMSTINAKDYFITRTTSKQITEIHVRLVSVCSGRTGAYCRR